MKKLFICLSLMFIEQNFAASFGGESWLPPVPTAPSTNPHTNNKGSTKKDRGQARGTEAPHQKSIAKVVPVRGRNGKITALNVRGILYKADFKEIKGESGGFIAENSSSLRISKFKLH